MRAGVVFMRGVLISSVALMYLVLAWRAAGFVSKSGPAGVPDDQVLQAA
jgi:hypothetical protein